MLLSQLMMEALNPADDEDNDARFEVEIRDDLFSSENPPLKNGLLLVLKELVFKAAKFDKGEVAVKPPSPPLLLHDTRAFEEEEEVLVDDTD